MLRKDISIVQDRSRSFSQPSAGVFVDTGIQEVSGVSREKRSLCLFPRLLRLFGLVVPEWGTDKKREQEDELLEARVEERTRELNRALIEIGDLAAQLNESLRQVEHLAITDALTETYNRRKFDEAVSAEHLRAERNEDPFALIMFDIDHFKQVNDNFGHSTGDLVLKLLCRLVRGLIRQGDLLIRWGGEEFLLLLPQTGIEEAGPLAERIRLEVEQNEFTLAGRITISLGVAQFQPGDSVDSLMKRVDNSLYKAKRNGRNRVILCDSE
jgi:diguanylate cyclase (GGDEF)-like protein